MQNKGNVLSGGEGSVANGHNVAIGMCGHASLRQPGWKTKRTSRSDADATVGMCEGGEASSPATVFPTSSALNREEVSTKEQNTDAVKPLSII